jgi:hypothetical protein
MDQFELKINQIICTGKFNSLVESRTKRLNAYILDNKIEITCSSREKHHFQFYVKHNIREIFHGDLIGFIKEKLTKILQKDISKVEVKINNIHYSISYHFTQREIPNFLEKLKEKFKIEDFGIAQETNCSVPANLSNFLANPTHDFTRVTLKCIAGKVCLAFQFNNKSKVTHLTVIASGHSEKIGKILKFLNNYGWTN